MSSFKYISINYIKRVILTLALCFGYVGCFSQQYFNKRIDINHTANASVNFLYSDSIFYISTRSEYLVNNLTYTKVGITKFYETSQIAESKVFSNNMYLADGIFGMAIKNNNLYMPFPSNASANYHQWGILKLTMNGDSVFSKNMNDTSRFEYGTSILNFNENFVVLGYTDSACGIGNPGNFILQKIDTLGTILKKKFYNMNGCFYRSEYKMDSTSEGGFVLCGYEEVPPIGAGQGQNYIVKVDSNLNFVWQHYYGLINFIAPSVTTLIDGNYLIATSEIDSVNFNNTIYWSKTKLIKVDKNNGSVIWSGMYGQRARSVGASRVKELPNGDLIAVGTTRGNDPYEQLSGFLLRTNSFGSQKWLKTYKGTEPLDSTGQNYLYDLIVMPDGGFAACGFVSPNLDTSGTGQDTWLLRTDSLGCITPDCVTLSSVAEVISLREKEILLYPNPANENVFVELRGLENTSTVLSIHNSLGQLMQTQNIQNRATINLSNYKEGIYLFRILYGDEVFTKKIVVSH